MKGVFNSAAFTIVNEGARVAPGATVRVEREVDGALATLYADKDGTAWTDGNPFTADDEGRFSFYADGLAAGYKITVSKNGVSHILRNVPIGSAMYLDVEDFMSAASVLLAVDGTAAAPAYSFASDPNTGMYRAAENDLGFSADGARQFQVSGSSTSVNFLSASGAATGAGSRISAANSGDTNVAILYVTKGSGVHAFYTGGSATDLQLRVDHTASAVNFLSATGRATGSDPYLQSNGSDTNPGMEFRTKGSGALSFRTNSGAQTQVVFAHTASAVNYVQVTGNVTTARPAISSQGSDTNVGLTYSSKGTGSHAFFTASSTQQFEVGHLASAVNYWQYVGAAAAGTLQAQAVGSDTNIGMNVISKGTGSHNFFSHAGSAVRQFQIVATASAVNFVSVTGAATGNGVRVISDGSDTNIQLRFHTKGNEAFRFLTNTGADEQLRVSHVASAVNYVNPSGSATGNNVQIAGAGSDTNVGFQIATKGSGNFDVFTNSNVRQLRALHVASAVNYAQVSGGATGNTVTYAAEGSDSNINLTLAAKGTGKVLGHTVAIPIACSDETTALTTGTAKVTFRMPFAMTLYAGNAGVRASLTTPQPGGSIFTVDINENLGSPNVPTTILSTKLTIDNNEYSSVSAATAPVISDTALADDAEISIDIDQVGTSGAKGLKVYLIGKITG